MFELVLPSGVGEALHWTESSASVGWALFHGGDEDLDRVLHRADQSMYQFKRAERVVQTHTA
jgi:hypothetical protein